MTKKAGWGGLKRLKQSGPSIGKLKAPKGTPLDPKDYQIGGPGFQRPTGSLPTGARPKRLASSPKRLRVRSKK